MKIQNTQDVQQIVFNHSPGINCKVFMKFYKKGTAKPYSSLVIGTTL